MPESIAVFEKDEDYYCAAFIAAEYLDRSGPTTTASPKFINGAKRMITDGFQACRRAGTLRGEIPTALLGEQILRSYRTTCRVWASGQVTIDQFPVAALSDV